MNEGTFIIYYSDVYIYSKDIYYYTNLPSKINKIPFIIRNNNKILT